ncbi:hypothetical protein [Mesorhizobium muleiense]|uniref:Uncharacterized protein n=1 Tax=Mesorhizobium muleiense TaxID=1004279 RepID=A0A1G9GCQ1_9HYPH|nr:hypothetical protein [Mesorhizobium muleiense]MCF6098790.1 hypothetical protein [Mesorhizobium muleiense]SDK98449.1 hypothetical protein SAMN05428953_12451 [Mesorhizobium muleiense]
MQIVLEAPQGMRGFVRAILSNHQAAPILAICQNVGKPLYVGGDDGKLQAIGGTGMPSMRDVVT